MSSKVRKIEVKGTESSKKLLCYNVCLCYDIFLNLKPFFKDFNEDFKVLCYKVFIITFMLWSGLCGNDFFVL